MSNEDATFVPRTQRLHEGDYLWFQIYAREHRTTAAAATRTAMRRFRREEENQTMVSLGEAVKAFIAATDNGDINAFLAELGKVLDDE